MSSLLCSIGRRVLCVSALTVLGLTACDGRERSEVGTDNEDSVATLAAALVVEPDCDVNPAVCCPSGYTTVQLTSANNTYQVLQTKRCVLALAGNDTVSDGSNGPTAVIGGPGQDSITTSNNGADLVHGGAQDDIINTFGGDDKVFGGPGNDTIDGSLGNDWIYPGPGIDDVTGSAGNDVVVLRDLCETGSLEKLRGSTGTGDKLITPVPVATLQQMGVEVSGFEQVLLEQHSCESACVVKPQCQSPSTCVEGTTPGEVKCGCAPGACPAPANPCLSAFCDPLNGACLTAPNDGALCDDLNPNTQGEICVSGACVVPPAQVTDGECGVEQAEAMRLKTDTAHASRRRQFEEGFQSYLALHAREPNAVYHEGERVIPVVIHSVYRNQAQRVDLAKAQAVIDTLNKDLTGFDGNQLNIDLALGAENQYNQFALLITNLNVRFELAKRDPACNATSGLVDHPTDKATFFDFRADDVKHAPYGSEAWPTERYLNIWVAEFECDGGWSTPPWELKSNEGVQLDYRRFEPTARHSLVHEVGHWLGLKHSFNACKMGETSDPASALYCGKVGDEVCDTPQAADRTFENNPDTAPARDTCALESPNLIDQAINFMDYPERRCSETCPTSGNNVCDAACTPETDCSDCTKPGTIVCGVSGGDSRVMFTTQQARWRVDYTLDWWRGGILDSDGKIPPGPIVAGDLWSSDTGEETGAEPNVSSEVLWASTDIWVRRSPPSPGMPTETTHENPVFGLDNHVFVRVRNRGCQAAPPASVQLHWAKASTGLAWPAPWTGATENGLPVGGSIGTATTVTLGPGQSQILALPWTDMPNPVNYPGGDNSRFCLLSRILPAPEQPVANIATHVQASNNMVWRNIEIATGTPLRAVVVVRGTGTSLPESLSFAPEPGTRGTSRSIFNWGTISVDLGPGLFARWDAGGRQGASVEVVSGTLLKLNQSDASVFGMALNPGESFPITLTFVPKLEGSGASPTPIADSYALDVIHKAGSGELAQLVGGQRVGVRTRVPAPLVDP